MTNAQSVLGFAGGPVTPRPLQPSNQQRLLLRLDVAAQFLDARQLTAQQRAAAFIASASVQPFFVVIEAKLAARTSP